MRTVAETLMTTSDVVVFKCFIRLKYNVIVFSQTKRFVWREILNL